MSKPNILTLTVGLPRSGKSTWARLHSCPIVNPDSIRLAIHGQRFLAQAEPYVWATAHAMVRALFLAGHDHVILDATNITKAQRARWLPKDAIWWTRYQPIATTREECMDRATAAGDLDMLPVIDRMAKQFEPLFLWETDPQYRGFQFDGVGTKGLGRNGVAEFYRMSREEST